MMEGDANGAIENKIESAVSASVFLYKFYAHTELEHNQIILTP